MANDDQSTKYIMLPHNLSGEFIYYRLSQFGITIAAETYGKQRDEMHVELIMK